MTHPSIHAAATPDKIAYRMAGSGEALTYAGLDAASNRGAHLLRRLGVGPRDHIALLIENSLRFMEICWAARRSGIYYTAISTHLTPGEIAFIVEDCDAKVFIASAATADEATQAASSLKSAPALFMTGEASSGWESWDAAVAAEPWTPIADEVAGYDMLYSSGTTGRPKGVLASFGNRPVTEFTGLIPMLCRDMCGMNANSIYLSPAPLYHAAPLRFNVAAASLGATSILMEKFDPEEFLRQIERNRATHSQLVPTMFVRMLKLPEETRLKYDISSLVAAVHAAAPCPIAIKQRMIDWWGPILIEYYAGTEANGVTIVNSSEWLTHPGTVGRPIFGKVKIVDEEGKEAPTAVVGTVYFADGPQFAYHNDPERTKGAYNSLGWSTLGDVGFVDGEGYLYLTDRKAYMIISGGVNIYPQETENILVTHPAVADVAVFGVPNEDLGEEVKAVVQLAKGFEPSPELEAALIAWCQGRLSKIKCPRTVDFVDALPRTPTGKLIKRVLRDKYWPKPASI